MARGTVKWFNSDRGYGFITPEGDGLDVFVGSAGAEDGGVLTEGEAVTYDIVDGPKGPVAENITRVGAEDAAPSL
ncbi:cold-shock protein [Streptomyces sp. NPDC088785]|uniref:cold-shock protein n=1 Tax=Streptomyces sp. NPDC088785 TaxID=3365897 RepID=UPI003824F922